MIHINEDKAVQEITHIIYMHLILRMQDIVVKQNTCKGDFQ